MAINPALMSGVRLTPIVKASKKAEINPIADRNFKEIPFIREAAETDNARERILGAWRKSPVMTLISMFTEGMDSKSIKSTIGFDDRAQSDRKLWVKTLTKAKNYMRERIAAEILVEPQTVVEGKETFIDYVSVIPDDFTRQYEDKHGDIITVNCAEKVRKGLAKALWRADYRVICSIARGVPFAKMIDTKNKPVYFKMWEVIDWTFQECEKQAHNADMKFQTIFNGQKGYVGERLPIGLARYVEERANSAEAVAAEAADDFLNGGKDE